jgi:hypothetical protein
MAFDVELSELAAKIGEMASLTRSKLPTQFVP